MKLYILMQIGCPECKTETKVIGYYDDIDTAASMLEKCNIDLQQTQAKVEFQVFQLPKLNHLDEYYRNK